MKVSDFLYFEEMHFYREPKGLSGAHVIISRDYRCFFKLDGVEVRDERGGAGFVVPAGTRSNGGSIPKIVPRIIVDNLGPFFEAYVIHDHLCREFGDKSERPWTSEVAANVLWAAMAATSGPAWQRELVYRAVKNFGPRWGAGSSPVHAREI